MISFKDVFNTRAANTGICCCAVKALLAFVSISMAFIIQERSTGMYFKSPPHGKIELVPSISDASIYETKRINNSPIILSIVHMKDVNEKGASRANGYVLDYSDRDNPLISYPYHGLSNQQFSFILDNDGYYQIVQNGQKFLRYDSASTSLVGGPFVDGENNGFLLWTNDGTTCYSGHKKKQGSSSFEIDEDLRGKDYYGGGLLRSLKIESPYNVYRRSIPWSQRRYSFSLY
uniref:Spore wall protein 1 n=1 Tax=Antonospora locustae TaxID=278021 RepID=G9HQ42_ANTLO|nr:spore wall protein 1 [Antonospora locustae]|eukprot:jgi/Antlo1/665/1184